MGFRDPLTTAEGVDTGQSPTGPGVRVFQKLSQTGSTLDRGVVEYRTGVAGDVPAVVELVPFVDVPDPDLARSFGNEFRIRGAGSNGEAPAELVLAIEEDPEGGWRPAARISHPFSASVSQPLTLNTPAVNWPAAVNYGTAWVHKDAASGRVTLHGNVTIAPATTLANNSVICWLPLSCFPRRILNFESTGGPNRPWRCDVSPSTGAVIFVAPMCPPAEWGFTPGVHGLSLDGLTWLARDVIPN